MATWNARTFRSKIELLNYLNGDLIGTVNLSSGALVDGLTFIVDAGAGNKTVTFAPAKGRAWTLAEIIAAITAADASLVDVSYSWVLDRGGVVGTPQEKRLALFRDGTLKVVSTGTANTRLGFSATADTIRAGIPDTAVFQITRMMPEQDSWVLVTYA